MEPVCLEGVVEQIAKTAYYCCGARAVDAARPRPLCGDTLAGRFMTAEANEIFARFKDLKGPNLFNVLRHRVIDDWLKERLRATPDLRIVLLGAGFDTRAFRLSGGRYVEIDQPGILAAKEAKLPASAAPNPLARVAIDFATESLAEKLAPWRGEHPVVVVMEGVPVYLRKAQFLQTLATLVSIFPRHVLMCDLMTATFVNQYCDWLKSWVEELGGHMGEAFDDPAAAVIASGYRERARISLGDRARELGALPMPGLLYRTVYRGLRDGYQVHRFEATG